MPLIRDKQVVADDPWRFLQEGEPVPSSGDVVVPLATLLSGVESVRNRAGRLGVQLEPADDPAELAPLLPQLSLIAIHFPRFGDGRGYSSARLLRERLGYKGELRSVGEVLGDQLAYMRRCGMDTFHLVDGKDLGQALRCFEDFSVAYQAAADDSMPLYRRVSRGQAPGSR